MELNRRFLSAVTSYLGFGALIFLLVRVPNTFEPVIKDDLTRNIEIPKSLLHAMKVKAAYNDDAVWVNFLMLASGVIAVITALLWRTKYLRSERMKKSVLIMIVMVCLGLGGAATAHADKIAELEQELQKLRADYTMKIQGLQEQIEEMKQERVAAREEISEKKDDKAVRVTYNPPLTFRAADNSFSLTMRGRIIPRFEYEEREDPALSNHSSFFLRRARLDFRGHLWDERTTFRLMPELGRTANLRDAWINYQFSPKLQLKLGQYQPLFHWERDSSSNSHQFVERSVAGEEFQFADGRDIGAMFHGKISERVHYGAGAFSGQGRNMRRSGSTGVLLSGRMGFVLAGKRPSQEALVKPVTGTNLHLGVGTYHASDNNVRDWHPWSGSTTESADISAATTDLHYQRGIFSSHLSGFYRWVDPRAGALDDYEGVGYTAQLGALLVPEKLFAALRYSDARPNRSENMDREREKLLSLQYYFHGHNSKVTLEGGQVRVHNGTRWYDTDLLRLQYQLLF